MQGNSQLKREDYLQLAKILDLQAFGNSILEFMVCKFYDGSDGSRKNSLSNKSLSESQSSRESSISKKKIRRIFRKSTVRQANLTLAKLNFSKEKQSDN